MFNQLMDVPTTLSGLGITDFPRKGTATVDFGTIEDGSASVTSTGQSWVTSGSIIVATPWAVTTADHDPDDYGAECLSCSVANVVPGVGFDIVCSAPNNTFGVYAVTWIGNP